MTSDQRMFFDRLTERLQASEPFVCVTLIDVHGSAPSDAGSRMIVDVRGLDLGTVGGGRVEAKAIDFAQQMLVSGPAVQFCDWSLKADVGMTCGGRVKLFFEVWNARRWRVVIFGAGHVTQAVVRLLESIDCQTICIDPREEWLSKLPPSALKIHTPEPAEQVDRLDVDSYVLCMTKGHQSDFPVLHKIFSGGRSFPFVGVIGSRAKAAVLTKELAAAGVDPSRIQFHCPVGLMQNGSPIGSHHPAEIAVSIVAQLLVERDRHRSPAGPKDPTGDSF